MDQVTPPVLTWGIHTASCCALPSIWPCCERTWARSFRVLSITTEVEPLDDRKKENLLTVVRRYADLGLQPVITLIDSDLPVRAEDDAPVFTASEIVVTLHDEGITVEFSR